MGSVKDLEILKEPTETALGEGVFDFSDRYSVFDWGEMPDLIEGKGQSLCMMAAWNFERLEELGVKTHYIGLLDKKHDVKKFDELGEPSSKMKVKTTRVLPTDNDYYFYKREGQNNFLIPLEIIFRNGLPTGSSIFGKIEKAEAEGKLEEVLKGLGLDSKPEPGEMLPEPTYDFSTKLEATDRPLELEEAKEISGLGDTFDGLIETAKKVNEFVTKHAEEVGMKHYDGKIEAFYFDEIVVCDVLGTFDENRFFYEGKQVSKEVMRQIYRKTDWYEDVQEARASGREDWKKVCASQPEHLPEGTVKLVSDVYKAGANLYTGKKIFDVTELKELMTKL